MIGPLRAEDQQVRPDLKRILCEQILPQAKASLVIPEPLFQLIRRLDRLPIIVAIGAAKDEIAPSFGRPLLPYIVDIPGQRQAGALQLDHDQRQGTIGVGMDHKPIDIATNSEFGKNPEVVGQGLERFEYFGVDLLAVGPGKDVRHLAVGSFLSAGAALARSNMGQSGSLVTGDQLVPKIRGGGQDNTPDMPQQWLRNVAHRMGGGAKRSIDVDRDAPLVF